MDISFARVAARILVLGTAVWVSIVPIVGAHAALPGEIVFRDDCSHTLVTMLPDGSGRQTLPAVPFSRDVQDVSGGTAGPVTALVIGRPSATAPANLHAVPIVRDVTGNLVSSLPVPLLGASDPQPWGAAVFSPEGDRVAYVGASATSNTTLFVGDVVRDASNDVSALANIVAVVDLASVGSPSNSAASPTGVGGIDFAPDGVRLVASIHDDLWEIRLAADGRTFAGATPLTRTAAFAETGPRWSPTAGTIAFAGTSYVQLSSPVIYSNDSNVYTLDRSTLTTKMLTAGSKDKNVSGPAWSPDGTQLAYSAKGASAFGRRVAPCGSLVNYDIFRVSADGSAKPVNVTNTAGTSVEQSPAHGW